MANVTGAPQCPPTFRWIERDGVATIRGRRGLGFAGVFNAMFFGAAAWFERGHTNGIAALAFMTGALGVAGYAFLADTRIAFEEGSFTVTLGAPKRERIRVPLASVAGFERREVPGPKSSTYHRIFVLAHDGAALELPLDLGPDDEHTAPFVAFRLAAMLEAARQRGGYR